MPRSAWQRAHVLVVLFFERPSSRTASASAAALMTAALVVRIERVEGLGVDDDRVLRASRPWCRSSS